MKSQVANLPLPDLRFEQTFMKALNTYATNSSKTKPLTEEVLQSKNENELEILNQELDIQEQQEITGPLAPITPGIVTYAIIKDQVIMPLIQGFVFTAVMILSRPFLQQVVLNGQRFGGYLATILGVNQFTRR